MSYMSEAEVNARVLAEGPAEPTPSVFIMGAGVVGTALAARLVRAASRSSACTAGRSSCRTRRARSPASSRRRATSPTSSRESDVVIISVRDERVPEVAERLAQREAAAARRRSCCTRRARTRRAPSWRRRVPHVRAVGTLHPLVSFADPRVAVEALKEVAFGIEGDEPARAVAKRIVRALGARAVFLEAENLAALPRGRGDGVELRRRAGRHGADAAGARRACRPSRRCRR